MPSHSMEERSRMILRLLQERERITVPELTRLFAASEVTIRQDLAQLEAQGKLTRIRGGAIRRSAPQRVGFDMRLEQRVPQKQAIARAAAGLVRDGDAISLDSSTTAYYLALELQSRKDLVVVTSSLRAAAVLSALPDATVLMPGGRVRVTSQSIVGDVGHMFEGRGRLRLGFFGISSVTEHGFLELGAEEALIKRRLIEVCDTVVAIFDSSKAGRFAPMRFAQLDEVNLTISDTGLPDVVADGLRSAGQEVVLVEVPGTDEVDTPEEASA
jgi:DeoR/GlpR family transcriptional regulator of sugar metabolism